ncbi:GntR family transcriptional regulator [Paenibacillus sp. BC26]|uniref:GntR family transcriptional regulator n=1 Tax=Paenibacillus sp. BC26 TaxID=1881032 RepID=UPI0008F31235|nr:GntR family transcriptional regulator [Paenibacillus sp. BC26]SFT15959.1 GntR family transcriptional regulator, arabinose operon transcriptional repressor [Paenibacillus sp. BC26]
MSQDREPLYIQIQNYFKDLIITRKLVEDDKIPTEKDLMDQFEVSRITVVNALAELAKDGWIYRIPGRGSFIKGIPETHIATSAIIEAAVPERTSYRAKIGLVFPFIGDYFAIRLLHGITEILEASKYSVVVMFTYNSKEMEKEVIRELKNSVDGLIIFPVDAEVYNEEIIALKMQNYPFVLIDRHLPGVETNVVSSDSVQASILAVDHLWSLGHRNIAICSDSPLMTVSVEERIQGYNEALKQKGALINPALILTDFHVNASQGSVNSLFTTSSENQTILNQEHPLYRFIKNRMATAYIALNCALGVHILSIAKQVGLRVPEDISIITFDNPSPLLEEFSVLTHIDQSEQEIGREAARLLLQVIDNRGKQPSYKKIDLQPSLVIRKTTGQLN